MRDMGADSAGAITTLTNPPTGFNAFQRFDADGNLLATTPESQVLGDILAEPASDRLYADGPSPNGGPNTAYYAYKYNSDGSGEMQIDSCQQLECGVQVLAATSQGDRIVRHATPTGGGTEAIEAVVTPADGTAAWTVNAPFDVGAGAFDSDRHVILVGSSEGGTFNGKTLPAGPTIMKLTLDGTLLWTQQVSGGSSAALTRVFTSTIGTVVVLGELESDGSFAGTSLHSGLILLTIEANGAPRWAKNIPGDPAENRWLAVDPSGRAAVMVTTSYCSFDLGFYDLAGDFLWSRSFAANDCSKGSLVARNLGFSGHDLVVGGDYSGSVDFGSGVKSASANSGFLLKLSP